MKLKNLSELRKYIQKKIDDSLKDEVFDAVRKIEIQHIHVDVLNKYSPKIYKRRSFGGIDDKENIVHEKIENGTLEVKNITKFNDDYETENLGFGLSELIEYGHVTSGFSYDYPSSDDFTEPRPFTENTIKELKKSKNHVQSLKKGLRKKGLETK